MLADKDRKPDQPRLLAVDNELVVPVNKTIRVLVTADPTGVIHAFAVPSFGIKIDAVPGRINETWFKATREGVYYGQCSELCGRDHAYMPIAVRVISEGDYNTWHERAKARYAGNEVAHPLAVAAAHRTDWTQSDASEQEHFQEKWKAGFPSGKRQTQEQRRRDRPWQRRLDSRHP